MPIISIAIQKGGSGKTTTAINLAAALKAAGKTVLLIDADPQANLSQSLAVPIQTEPTLQSAFLNEMALDDKIVDFIDTTIHKTRSGIDVIPSSFQLSVTEQQLVSEYGGEQYLTWMLENLKIRYEFIIIDCPPSIGMLTVNALVASDYVLLPMLAEFLSVKGVEGFMHHYKAVVRLNKKLKILGFVLTRYDERKTMNKQIFQQLISAFGEKAFVSKIRNNIQLAKAQEAGMDILSFDKHSHGAEDYQNLSNEFLHQLEMNEMALH